MSTLEDKLLGEKTANYCSSSEEEDNNNDDNDNGGANRTESGHPSESKMEEDNRKMAETASSWQGYSRNTGPKGVLRDWELFKEHEKQERIAKEKELVKLCAQSTMTCRTEEEDRRVIAKEKLEKGEIDDDDLLSDDVLRDFLHKRMDAMLKQHQVGEFGDFEEITSADAFLKLVDETNQKVTIIVHIYEAKTAECVRTNECLLSLCSSYRHVKFSKLRATLAGVSSLFRAEGIPALLVYKGGNLVGNFVRLKEDFGSEFYPGDVENFLLKNGVLQEQGNISALLKEKCQFNS